MPATSSQLLSPPPFLPLLFFFFNDTATTEIYTLSLHDALPISRRPAPTRPSARRAPTAGIAPALPGQAGGRSEEHTSELQSRSDLVCRLLLEKKKNNKVEQVESLFWPLSSVK